MGRRGWVTTGYYVKEGKAWGEGCKILPLRSEQREECLWLWLWLCLCLWNVNVYVYETPSPQIYTPCHGFWLPPNSFWNSKCSLRYPRLFRHTSDTVFFLPIPLTSPLLSNPACFNDFIKMETIGWRNRNYEGRYLVNAPENSAIGCAVRSAFSIWINDSLNKDHIFSWTSHLYLFSSNKFMKYNGSYHLRTFRRRDLD